MPTYLIIPSPQPPYLDPPNENLHISESSKLLDGVNGPVGNGKYTKVVLHALKGVPGADAALPDGYPHILDYTPFFQFITAGVIVAEPENLRDPANTFNLPPADVIAMVIYFYLRSHGTNLQWDCNDSDYAAFAIRLFGEDYPCWKYGADDIDGNGEYAEIKRDFGDITFEITTCWRSGVTRDNTRFPEPRKYWMKFNLEQDKKLVLYTFKKPQKEGGQESWDRTRSSPSDTAEADWFAQNVMLCLARDMPWNQVWLWTVELTLEASGYSEPLDFTKGNRIYEMSPGFIDEL